MLRTILMNSVAICRAQPEAGQADGDLPLTDPKHPLHRAPDAPKSDAPKAEAKPVTKTTKGNKPRVNTKPTAQAKKPHEPSKIVSTDTNPSKSIVPPKFKTLYAAHGGSNGDNVALALKAAETINGDGRPVLDWDTMLGIAKANEIDLSAYAHLNAGQKRMNLGNKLRGMIKAGKTVVIGKRRIATLKAAEPAETAKAA